MSRAGKRVTWILCDPSWGLLVDNNLETPCAAIVNKINNRLAPQAFSPQNVEKIENNMIAQNEKKRSKEEKEEEEEFEAKKKKLDSRVFNLNIQFETYWCTPLNKTMKIELFPIDEEFKKIENLMRITISEAHKQRYKYSKFKITKLERLQSPDLWGLYFLRRNEIGRINEEKPELIDGSTVNLIDRKTNEYYLFHGCNESILEKISNEGFDERVSNLSGMFGCGIYFAENSSKSDIYAHTKDCAQVGAFYSGQINKCTCQEDYESDRVMFVARVAMGSASMHCEATDKTDPMRKPPKRPGKEISYDSVIGESRMLNPKASLDYREFIIYDRRQCYGEYIIHYKRVQ